MGGNVAACRSGMNFATMREGQVKDVATNRRWLPVGGAVITGAALLLQFTLFLRKGPELGLGALAASTKFFTFMTNLTGVGVMLVFTAALRADRSPWLRWARAPATQGAMLVYVALVGMVYHFLLADAWHPDRAWWAAAFLLHYLMPCAYVSYWLLCVPGRRLRWAHVAWWQVFPIGYVIVVMLIGPRLGGYPYPFLDVGLVGWTSALLTMAVVLAGYIGLSAAVVALDHWRGA